MPASNTYLGFNLNPASSGYSSSFGGIPGATGAPPSVYGQIGAVVPGLSNLTGTSASDIQSELSGQLSPGTIDLLKNQSATWGVESGMPGSGAAGNDYLRSLGLTSEQVQNQGIGNYMNFLGSVGNTQLSPDLLSNIAQSNAVLGSAPNPQNAAVTQQSNAYANMMLQYLLSGGGGGGGGFTGIGGGVTPSSQRGDLLPFTDFGSSVGSSNVGNVVQPDYNYMPTNYGAPQSPDLATQTPQMSNPTGDPNFASYYDQPLSIAGGVA